MALRSSYKTKAKKIKSSRSDYSFTAYSGSTSRVRKTEKYPENWSEISSSVKLRDGYCCRKCGRTNNLEVHHIIPISKGGNNSQSNLITLCSLCHKKQPRHGHLR